MRTCYLHLGMPKTGSSSIQQAFHRFNSGGLAYAKMGGVNHGMPLAIAFSESPETLPEHRWREIDAATVAQRVKRMKRKLEGNLSSRKDIIFSGEGIVDRLKPDEFRALAETLKSRFDRVVAMAYIRPLASLAASQFQQRIKTGLGRFQIPSPDYRKRFQQVVDNFGSENVQFFRFDRKDLHEGDIVADFAHRLGLSKAPQSGVTTNESLSSETLGSIYAFNKFTAPLLRPAVRTQMRQDIQKHLADFGATKFGLSEELIARHQDRHKDDVAWMEEASGFDVKGSYAPVPDPVTDERSLLRFAAQAGRNI